MEPLPNKTLGQRLRELRQKADLALRDLGEKLKDPETGTHVSAAFLSDIENGRRFPSDDMIEKLAAIFGVEGHELRSCDPRGPAKEMQDLATMNPQYAFAFRRAIDFVRNQKLSPWEFVRRVQDDSAAAFVHRVEGRLGREIFPADWDTLLQTMENMIAHGYQETSTASADTEPDTVTQPPHFSHKRTICDY